MVTTKEKLLLQIAAVEQRHSGDQERLRQLAKLRRRIDEEISEPGCLPPIEIVTTLLQLIDSGRVPPLEPFRKAVVEVLADRESDC